MGKSSWLPEMGWGAGDHFLPRGEEDRKHRRDKGVVREVETEAEESWWGGGLEREARRPKGPRRGKARGLDTAWGGG